MFDTLSFWVALVALFVAVQFIPSDRLTPRALYLSAISLAAMVVIFHLDWRASLLILGGLAWITFSVCRLAVPRGARSMRQALLLIAPVAAVWAVGKLASANQAPLGWLFFVGASFFLVKSFGLLRDRLDGKAPDVKPALVLAYLAYLPTWFSGPMHNWPEFRNTLANLKSPSGEAALDIVFRFVWGLFKVQVLATVLVPHSLIPLANATVIPVRGLITAAVVYSLVLYFNFSGYTDMVIAASRAVGIEVPENFNWPYLSTSIREFWRRWHITFSRVLMAHVFTPVARALTGRLPRPMVPIFGYIATFTFAGFWHGSAVNFLLWGAYHGFGLTCYDLGQKLRAPKAGYRQPRDSLFGKSLKVAATFAFVSIGWVFFVLPVDRLARIAW